LYKYKCVKLCQLNDRDWQNGCENHEPYKLHSERFSLTTNIHKDRMTEKTGSFKSVYFNNENIIKQGKLYIKKIARKDSIYW
jgi:hypothetical protein